MSALSRLSRLAVIPTGALVYAQGRRLRRNTPILPDAARPWQGSIPGPRPLGPLAQGSPPLRLLVLGDSTAAGVGAPTQDAALPGHLGRAISELTGRGIEWRAIGENGVDAREFIERYLDEATAESWDIVFVSLGANDALGLRSRRAFARDIRAILQRIRETSPEARIMVSSLPAFFRFELLPNPLRWNLYLHSRNLEAGARAVVESFSGAHMSPPPPPYTDGFFATDLFHPSAQGYRDWANFAVEDAVSAGLLARG